MGIMTRKRAVDTFYAQLESEFNKGHYQYLKVQESRVKLSNDRLKKVLRNQRDHNFVHQLDKFITTTGAKSSRLSIVRAPVGIQVLDRRFDPAEPVWFDTSGGVESPYITVSIEIRHGRWLQFRAYH